jgi:hypothetical protein
LNALKEDGREQLAQTHNFSSWELISFYVFSRKNYNSPLQTSVILRIALWTTNAWTLTPQSIKEFQKCPIWQKKNAYNTSVTSIFELSCPFRVSEIQVSLKNLRWHSHFEKYEVGSHDGPDRCYQNLNVLFMRHTWFLHNSCTRDISHYSYPSNKIHALICQLSVMGDVKLQKRHGFSLTGRAPSTKGCYLQGGPYSPLEYCACRHQMATATVWCLFIVGSDKSCDPVIQ